MSRAAVVAGDEVQTVLTLVELGVGRLAGLASDVLDCKFPSQLMHLTGLAASRRPMMGGRGGVTY